MWLTDDLLVLLGIWLSAVATEHCVITASEQWPPLTSSRQSAALVPEVARLTTDLPEQNWESAMPETWA